MPEHTDLTSSTCRTTVVVSAIACLAIILMCDPGMPARGDALPTNTGPIISCSSPVFDFGPMDNEDTIKHTFILGNSGNAILKIDKIISCCGSRTVLETRAVDPGAQSALHVTSPLKGRSGAQHMVFYVRSNDPVRPLYELVITGKALAKVEVRPASIMFGVIAADVAVDRIVRVIPESNIVFSVTNVICSMPCISAAYVGCTNMVHHVLVRTVPPLPSGITRAIVSVQTDDTRYRQIDIPIVVRATKDIVVFPQEIRLTKALPGQVHNTQSQYAVVKSLSKTPFKLVGSEVPADGVEVFWVDMASGGYKLEIRNLLPIDEMDGKQVILKTDNERVGDIVIPVSVVAAPQE